MARCSVSIISIPVGICQGKLKRKGNILEVPVLSLLKHFQDCCMRVGQPPLGHANAGAYSLKVSVELQRMRYLELFTCGSLILAGMEIIDQC